MDDQLLQFRFHAFSDSFKCSDYYWHLCHLHVFQLSDKDQHKERKLGLRDWFLYKIQRQFFAYTICLYGQNLVICTFPTRSLTRPVMFAFYSFRVRLSHLSHLFSTLLHLLFSTLSRHFSLSFIASGWSSGLHPVSSHSCCMYVRAGRPAFARPYAGVHRSTSLMSSSLLLQQCPACLVRLSRIVFVMGDRWPYSWCLVGCCRQKTILLLFYPFSHQF